MDARLAKRGGGGHFFLEFGRFAYHKVRGVRGTFSPILFLSDAFLVVFFSFFEKKLPIVVVCDVCPSVRPSVEIFSFCGISISNRPIDLKMSMNVRKGVVHVRNA